MLPDAERSSLTTFSTHLVQLTTGSRLRLLMAVLSLALLVGCGDGGTRSDAPGAQFALEVETNLTIRDALVERNEGSTDILIEASVATIPAVRERVGRLKTELDDRRANNSICVGGKRATIGKTAFICNDHDYDVLILARSAGQTISANLSYIEEFAEDPLRSGLIEAMRIVSAGSIDGAEANCMRLVFKDPASGRTRKDVPIIVMVRSGESENAQLENDDDLRYCLE